MGELERIEAAYGSVAEYQRVMAEEYEYDDYGNLVPREEYEPTEEELEKERKEHEDYMNMIKYFSGEVDADTKALKEEIYSHEPKREDFDEYNKYVRAGYDFYDRKVERCIDFIEKKYNVKFDKDFNVYHGMDINKFGLNVKQEIHCQIFYPAIGNLDYDLFAQIFRDLHYLRMSPTFFYNREDGRGLLYGSNLSLGEIRWSYISGQDCFPGWDDLKKEWNEYKEKQQSGISSIMSGN